MNSVALSFVRSSRSVFILASALAFAAAVAGCDGAGGNDHADATAEAGEDDLTFGATTGCTASNWQYFAQVPQAMHFAGSTSATYPDEASIGMPCRCACIAPQQQRQQLQP